MTSFTPNPNFDKENSNPKDWAYHLGCLPQKHHIVFTKEDFVTFLKQHNVHVGPNFTELAKLPKYATIGKLTVSHDAGPSAAPATSTAAQTSQPQHAFEAAAPEPSTESTNVVYTSSGEVFRPSRKVRQLPGGGSAQVTALFGSDAHQEEPAPVPARRAPAAPIAAPAPADDGFEPLGAASARRVASGNVKESHFYDDVSSEKPGVYEGVRNDAVMNNGFRPTRRVRVPGGTGGLSSIAFD
ncbi:uncharacterized protein SRS1_15136 [Sporisorium reilianum f. sp. reilianum]|uniref:Uncharacterized protein n=1 Tax=Sporisorium reilianum f. sp. reilianum TaxID=72559 RepID=A0A2N8UJ97_9BASI|nr:uncharacterized protein SRS1_15136 [Sporisorium reilianum f. sp. reilianum]